VQLSEPADTEAHCEFAQHLYGETEAPLAEEAAYETVRVFKPPATD